VDNDGRGMKFREVDGKDGRRAGDAPERVADRHREDGPVVGGLVGLVLAISSWYLYGATFITFADGNLLVALLAAFLPRILIGVLAYYVYRPLRRRSALAAGVAGLVGTLTNTFGVLGLLIWLGAMPASLLVPVFSMNVPIEVALALVVTIPTVAALRAVGRGRIAAARD